MDKPRCVDVRHWIQQIVLSDEPTPPESAFAAHIASCQICRGALVLMAAQAITLPSFTAPISCRQSEEDLAAFIEQEQEEGSVAAIRTYPHIWWHLWICEDCAETYRIIRLQFMPEQSQVQAISKIAVPRVIYPARRTPLLHLQRHFLHHALAASLPTRAATRGHRGQSYVLTEQEHADIYFMVSVHRQPNGEWRVDVVHRPPPSGSLVLTLGTNLFQARFNSQGHAIVYDVPFALLTAPDGPGLEVEIEADA